MAFTGASPSWYTPDMKLFAQKPPWYVAGLAFECTGCGVCCSGPAEGYVWLTDKEIIQIAHFLNISPTEMKRRYVRRVGTRRSLKERQDNHDCIFLVPREEGGKKCSIYPVRPSQCRTWPFWPGNLTSPEDWALAGLRCEGINRGDIHGLDEIEDKRRTTGH